MNRFPAFVLCICLSVSVQAQKWYKITKNDIAIMSLQAASGVADGFNQAIVHHKFKQGSQFWDNKISWQNKYKCFPQDKSPAYFGSKSVLVWTTDGFHLTRFIDRSMSVVSVGISLFEVKEYKADLWKVIVKKILLSYIANRTAFVIVFNKL